MYSGYLTSADILKAGDRYTFTFDHGRIFEYHDITWIVGQLSFYMQNYGHIITADRTLFSDRYVIVVEPTLTATLQQWLDAFDYSWEHMGYGKATFIIAEGGIGSSEPGGVNSLAKQVGGAVGGFTAGTISGILKEIWPYLALGAGAYILLEFVRGEEI